MVRNAKKYFIAFSKHSFVVYGGMEPELTIEAPQSLHQRVIDSTTDIGLPYRKNLVLEVVHFK